MFNKIIIMCVRCYKACISPLMGSNCRFTPTCSTYAIQAFNKYSFFKALVLVVKRLAKCHPLHPGGYDPI